jgi:hypothetical protein
MGTASKRTVPTLVAVGLSGPGAMKCPRLGGVCIEVYGTVRAPVPVRPPSLQIDWWQARSRQ